MDTLSIIAMIISLFLLLACSAFFSGSETALFAVPRFRIEAMREHRDPRARRVARLLSRPNHLLVAILVGNLAVNVVLTEILGYRIAEWCVQRRLSEMVAYLIATGAMTTLLLLFGEVTPKIIAVQNAERISLWIAGPIALFCRAIRPIQYLLEMITGVALAVMRLFRLQADPFVTEKDVITALGIGEEQGVVEREERRMIQSIFEFSDIQVEQIMVPRPDMVILPVDATCRQALATVNRSGFSRIPVYNQSIDDVVGVLYGKDLLPFVNRNDLDGPVEPILRPPYFVPPTKHVHELAAELRRRKTHIAVVVDEYGGTAGLITLEDVIEEIIGEIEDESDVPEQMVEKLDDRTFLVDARLELDELEELLGTDLPKHENNTVGGLVMELLGHVPTGGEATECGGAMMVVEEVRGRRVRRVRIEMGVGLSPDESVEQETSR